MAQFLSCVGKIMNDPSGDGVIAKFSFFVAFFKWIEWPSMAVIEAPGSPLSNKLLFIEIRQHGHIEWLNFALVLGKYE